MLRNDIRMSLYRMRFKGHKMHPGETFDAVFTSGVRGNGRGQKGGFQTRYIKLPYPYLYGIVGSERNSRYDRLRRFCRGPWLESLKKRLLNLIRASSFAFFVANARRT
uniref:Uncharacterized protein n=1 Tax=Vespula pensylvanica TaxID=30213 RepID=A0A834UAY0_VESPE|nr:hypothetical protein H0235_006854 [Vespula pensylvanica]